MNGDEWREKRESKARKGCAGVSHWWSLHLQWSKHKPIGGSTAGCKAHRRHFHTDARAQGDLVQSRRWRIAHHYDQFGSDCRPQLLKHAKPQPNLAFIFHPFNPSFLYTESRLESILLRSCHLEYCLCMENLLPLPRNIEVVSPVRSLQNNRATPQLWHPSRSVALPVIHNNAC